MAVLPHEGAYNILYRGYGLPVGSTFAEGYLARPDRIGRYPIVLVLPDIFGVGSHEKDLCRRLARHGYAALALDLYRGSGPPRDADLDDAIEAYAALPDRRALTDIDQAVAFVRSQDVDWALPDSVGLLGVDTGGRFALLYAADREVGAVVAVQAPLAGDETRLHQVESVLPRLTVPTLGLYGGDDDLVPAEGVDVAQGLNRGGTWILYEGAGHGFLDADSPHYHAGASADALVRITKFFATHLASPAPAAY